MDFSDDSHLAAALRKNKQFLLGKKLSIARSAPKQGRKGSTNHGVPAEHGRLNSSCSTASVHPIKFDVFAECLFVCKPMY